MSVLDGFKEVGERTGGKLTMTVMLESVRFSKGVSEVLGRPEYVKLLVNYERGKFAIQVCDENDDFALQFNAPNADTPSSVTTRNLDLLVATQKFFTFPEVPADKIAFFALDGEYHSDHLRCQERGPQRHRRQAWSEGRSRRPQAQKDR